MMLGVLDLGNVTVDDIMVPRTEIIGIDIDDDMDEIVTQLRSVQHTRLPVFKEDVDRIIGMLHIRNAARFLIDGELTKAALLQESVEPYFVPESTPLQKQLINFQKEKERIALVVDEYGDIQGIVTIEDILEEIVGDFTSDIAATSVDIHPQEDGSFLIDGGTHIRLINSSLGWTLPIEGPKTLNGLITEHLETIPDANVCFTIEGYRFEIIQIQDNMIRTAKLSEPPEPF
jgi:Mg2+/Co2+ transporter CorB